MEGEGGVVRIGRSAVAIPGVGEVPVPAVVAASGPELANRFLEFFLVAIRNPNTRRAYAAAVRAFCAWLERHGAPDLAAVEPVHVAAYVEQLGRTHAKPSVALHLAAIKRLFAFLVAGGTLKRSPGRRGQGADLLAPDRGDAGHLDRGGAQAAREPADGQPGRPARPGADRHAAVHHRPDRRRAALQGRRLLPGGLRPHAPPAREGRQGAPRAGPPPAGRVPRELPRRGRPARGARGAAVPLGARQDRGS